MKFNIVSCNLLINSDLLFQEICFPTRVGMDQELNGMLQIQISNHQNKDLPVILIDVLVNYRNGRSFSMSKQKNCNSDFKLLVWPWQWSGIFTTHPEFWGSKLSLIMFLSLEKICFIIKKNPNAKKIPLPTIQMDLKKKS